MKRIIKHVAIATVLLGSLGIYWHYKVSGQTDDLARIAQPFDAACNSSSGCVLIPPGWEPMQDAYRLDDDGEWIKSTDTASFQGKMEYVANSNSFELRWHVAIDVYLVARGGTGRKLVITRAVA